MIFLLKITLEDKVLTILSRVEYEFFLQLYANKQIIPNLAN